MTEFDELAALAVSASDPVERQRLAARARKKVIVKKSRGAPSQFTEKIGKTICVQLSNGKTITRIAESLGITPECVYGWVKKYPDFAETYRQARESMARSLVDQLIDESEKAEPDRAMLLKVRGGIIQWVAARLNPVEFSDSRRIELRGEVTHKHTHELSPEQKKRIAESWIISQLETDCLPGAVVSTIEPDWPSIGPVVGESEPSAAPRKKKALVKSKPVKADDW